MPKETNADHSSEDTIFNMNWLFHPTKFMAWLGASIGGLGILLGVIGFLALGAHDQMLGLPTTQLEDIYIVGGLFFIRSVVYLAQSIFGNMGNIWCWLFIGIFLLVLIIRSYIFKHIPKISILFFLFVFVFLEFFTLWRLGQPLQFHDILFQVPDQPSEILKSLLSIDNELTYIRYKEYGFLFLLVLITTITFRSLDHMFKQKNVLDVRNLWKWIRIPAFLLLILCFFILPRDYGVLTLPNDYPRVVKIWPRLSVENSPKSTDPEDLAFPLLLLHKDKESLLLYDLRFKTMVNLNPQKVERFTVSAPKHISYMFTDISVKSNLSNLKEGLLAPESPLRQDFDNHGVTLGSKVVVSFDKYYGDIKRWLIDDKSNEKSYYIVAKDCSIYNNFIYNNWEVY
jgi:hypothetical protein